jgi:hypothetical protein
VEIRTSTSILKVKDYFEPINLRKLESFKVRLQNFGPKGVVKILISFSK